MAKACPHGPHGEMLPYSFSHADSDRHFKLAMIQWRQNFQGRNSDLTDALLGQIEKQRNGDFVDEALLKKVIDSFISLGFDEAGGQTLDVYMNDFWFPFIAATETYYREESAKLLTNASVSNYIRRIEERLEEEAERVDRCLHRCSRNILITTCERVFIAEKAEVIRREFRELFRSDNIEHEDLQRTYALLFRVPEEFEPLRKEFGGHDKWAGLVAAVVTAAAI